MSAGLPSQSYFLTMSFWMLPGAVPAQQILNKAEGAWREKKQHLGTVAWLHSDLDHVVSSPRRAQGEPAKEGRKRSPAAGGLGGRDSARASS